MKKLFLVVLAAGLFAACGNGNKEADENATNDSIPAQDEVVMDQPAEEAQVAEATTTETETTIKEEAKKVGTEVAKEAINAGGDQAKEAINNGELPKKPRR